MASINTKHVMLAIMIAAAIVSPMVGATVTLEQVVMAQNMTENMTSPNWNMTGTENASGAISGIRGWFTISNLAP